LAIQWKPHISRACEQPEWSVGAFRIVAFGADLGLDVGQCKIFEIEFGREQGGRILPQIVRIPIPHCRDEQIVDLYKCKRKLKLKAMRMSYTQKLSALMQIALDAEEFPAS
jgi:hypothetical protein